MISSRLKSVSFLPLMCPSSSLEIAICTYFLSIILPLLLLLLRTKQERVGSWMPPWAGMVGWGSCSKVFGL